MEFELTHNVKAIRGLAMKHILPEDRKRVNPKSLQISLNGDSLRDSDRLLSFSYLYSILYSVMLYYYLSLEESNI